MLLSKTQALIWTQNLIALAVFLQTLEFLQIRKTWGKNPIWDWEVIRIEFQFLPRYLRFFLDAVLNNSRFIFLLLIRAVAAVFVFFIPHPAFFFILLSTTVLISLRWRGTFNGGSDFMTLIVLTALVLGGLFAHTPGAQTACLWYIAFQTSSSYFISGLAKITKRNWRTGKALKGFFESTVYEPSPVLGFASRRPRVLFFASWFVMIFECTFPVALVNPNLCLAYLGLALGFHLANFYVFGLNRFLFAWAAAYPALYFCSQYPK
ncbi:MAG: HTTM domain-containing protein [Bdellovibrionota bacterium]